MASSRPPGSSGPPSHINSPIHSSHGQDTSEFLGKSSLALTGQAERSRRIKKDSRKKREAKGLDTDSSVSKKKATGVSSSAVPSSTLSILRPMLLTDPRSSDVLPPQPRQMNFAYQKKSNVLGQSWDFYEVVDKLTNKNGYRYSYAMADPGFPHIRYRQIDLPPYNARFSFEDSPAAMTFSKDALAVSTNEPWHSARANVCAREGSYYYEARIISGIVKRDSRAGPDTNDRNSQPGSRGHVRIGFARREAELDVNVGVDCYGYGLRDVNGEVINRMRCEYFFPKDEAIYEGDVIGMLITLPPLSVHKKIVEGTYDPALDGDGSSQHPFNTKGHPPSYANLIRDRIPFHLKSDFCWQQSNIFATKQLRDYAFNLKDTPTFGPPSPLNAEDASLRTLPGSSITIYKNGMKMGTPFKELYAFLPPASRLVNGTNNVGLGERENADDGMIGYFPTVSCYGGGAVECRFEAPWWIGPPSVLPSEEVNTNNSNDDPEIIIKDEQEGDKQTTEHTPSDSATVIRPFGERFNDQIVEDILADIVDEVEAMLLWGGGDLGSTDCSVNGLAGATRPGSTLKQNANGNISNGILDYNLIRNGGNRTPTPAGTTPDVVISDEAPIVLNDSPSIHPALESIVEPGSLDNAPTTDHAMLDSIPIETGGSAQGSQPGTVHDQDVEMADS